MGARDPACLSDRADRRAGFDRFTQLHCSFGEVAVHRDESLTMIDHDRSTIEEVIAHCRDNAMGDGYDGGTFRCCDVESTVWASGFSV